MDSVTLSPAIAAIARPLPGRVILRILPKPAMEGMIHVPDTARAHTVSDTLQEAVVVAVGYGGHVEDVEGKVRHFSGVAPDDFGSGHRVLFRPLAMELNEEYVLTDVRRVDAVVEP